MILKVPSGLSPALDIPGHHVQDRAVRRDTERKREHNHASSHLTGPLLRHPLPVSPETPSQAMHSHTRSHLDRVHSHELIQAAQLRRPYELTRRR